MNKLLNELGIPPDSSDFDVATDHHSFSVLYIVEEFADIDAPIWIDLLSVFIADAIVEDTYDLRAISHIVVASVASHLRVMKLPRVSVSIVESRDSLSLEEPESELSLEHSVGVVEYAESMHFASFELSFVG